MHEGEPLVLGADPVVSGLLNVHPRERRDGLRFLRPRFLLAQLLLGFADGVGEHFDALAVARSESLGERLQFGAQIVEDALALLQAFHLPAHLLGRAFDEHAAEERHGLAFVRNGDSFFIP